jgi:hypothetical protein
MNNTQLLQTILACQYDIESDALTALRSNSTTNSVRIIEIEARMTEIEKQINLIDQKL